MLCVNIYKNCLMGLNSYGEGKSKLNSGLKWCFNFIRSF